MRGHVTETDQSRKRARHHYSLVDTYEEYVRPYEPTEDLNYQNDEFIESEENQDVRTDENSFGNYDPIFNNYSTNDGNTKCEDGGAAYNITTITDDQVNLRFPTSFIENETRRDEWYECGGNPPSQLPNPVENEMSELTGTYYDENGMTNEWEGDVQAGAEPRELFPTETEVGQAGEVVTADPVQENENEEVGDETLTRPEIDEIESLNPDDNDYDPFVDSTENTHQPTFKIVINPTGESYIGTSYEATSVFYGLSGVHQSSIHTSGGDA